VTILFHNGEKEAILFLSFLLLITSEKMLKFTSWVTSVLWKLQVSATPLERAVCRDKFILSIVYLLNLWEAFSNEVRKKILPAVMGSCLGSFPN